MKTQKYAVNQYLIESVLSKVREGEIAIPEIQRPFVWDASQVRDLLDSLYQGFPVGYLIAWRNPDVKLKDGSTASGKMILIDGQQRITALTAAVLGQPVVNKEYRKVRISIAFHPIEERFEVTNPAITKNAAWISDVSSLVGGEVDLFDAVEKYLADNPSADKSKVKDNLRNLADIAKKQIGLIELSHDLDIETVTEIFIRINSKGTVLSQADFVMSKIAADLRYGGQQLRKCIDYFCHLAVAPEFYGFIKDNDPEFAASPYFQKMAWLRNENDDLYDPSYNDLLRVAFTSEFGRGKLADLVSLLSGRNFETKNYEEAIAEASFAKLKEGVLDFINESHFKRFVMIIKSAGFITTEMIRTQGALNFAYIVYLRLRAQGIHDGKIGAFVRRWFVMSVLTGRYSGSAETQFDQDIRQIASGDFADILAKVESAELSPAFWEVGLVQQLETSGTSSPYFWVFVAAQVRANDTGLLSKDITVRELVSHLGDIHHIFPRDLLKKAGLTRSQYNQIANYAYTQEEINIKIGNKPPRAYFADIQAQLSGGPLKYGAIADANTLKANLAANCVPESIVGMDVEQFDDFLALRRQLMAEKIRSYYEGL
ncbi:MAG: DUF262 domain-containing protein [Pseudomonadota bacterium]